jgi:23S rRNA pseudouridine955/2504/2580 synthase
MRKIKINENQAPQRLDRFLGKYLSASSAGNIQKLLRKKVIRCNGEKSVPARIIAVGDEIEIRLNDPVIEDLRAKKQYVFSSRPLTIVFEDSDILLVHKPAGLLVHPDSRESRDTLIARVHHYLHTSITGTFAPSSVNRLDRNTSGIVLFGKRYESLQYLNRYMREGKIRKQYLAVAAGHVNRAGEVCGYQIKNRRTNRVVFSAHKQRGAKYVHTKYVPREVLAGKTLCEIELITGRSHQIRAAFAEINHPLVGDRKYGGTTMGNQSYFLHAWRLDIAGRRFECPNEALEKFWSREGGAFFQ